MARNATERLTRGSVARLQAPIVLAHGLFFNRIGLGKLTLASYFRGIPQWLRAAGNRVAVTRVPAIAGVEERARCLAVQIEAAFPGEPVHVIGHSMGGLDARVLLANPASSGKILSLTTIGTPHLGTALADFAKLKAGRIYRLLSALEIDHRGCLDITRNAARVLNEKLLPPPDVPCFSVAGNPTVDHVCWPLRRLYAALWELEGDNDGLVSVASASAFGTPLLAQPVDHLRQIDWLKEHSGMISHSTAELYGQITKNLADHGFALPDDMEVVEASLPPPPEVSQQPQVG
jgi:triacylglycerol lipase